MKLILIIMLFSLASCIRFKAFDLKESKNEIMQVETDFNRMAAEQGVEKAFLHFAAPGAVLMRNDKILKGESDFKSYFSSPAWQDSKLSWKPDFVDVAESGDLAYTYGSYSFTFTNSDGNQETSTGIFHTVWKKQEDGQWKFVWD